MAIEWLKNKFKQKFYPVSHENAILCGDNADITLKEKLDGMRTSTMKGLYDAGWYRIAEIDSVYSSSCIIKIGNVFINDGCEEHVFLFSKAYLKNEFMPLSCKYEGQKRIFTQLRRVDKDGKCYIEAYYNSSLQNNCLVTVLSMDSSNMVPWKAINWESALTDVEEGATIVCTYDIPENVTPATSLDLARLNGEAILYDSILETALTLPEGDHNFKLAGGNYTGSDLPHADYRYGQATIKVRGAIGDYTHTTVILWGTESIYSKYITVNYYDGTVSKWSGWQTQFTTAGGVVGGNNTTTPMYIKGSENKSYLGFRNNSNSLIGYLGFDYVNRPIYQGTDNVAYPLLHTGNMANHVIPRTRDSLSTSIIEKALTLDNGIYFFPLGGNYYTGDDLPKSNHAWEYSNAMVLKRNDVSLEIVLFSEMSGRIAVKSYHGGLWDDWYEVVATADLANYLSLNGGGTVNGAVHVNNNQISPLVVSNSGGQNTTVAFKGSTGTLGHLGFNMADNPAYLPGDGSSWHALLHTGNKPTGTYTGTGSAELRYIYFDVSTIGELVYVRGNGYFNIVSPSGTFSVNTLTGETSWIDGCAAFRTNELVPCIVLFDSNEAINASGVTYTYQVL